MRRAQRDNGVTVQMPFVNAVEVATLAGAFLIFWVAPTVFGRIAALRRRRPEPMGAAVEAADVGELPPAAEPPETTLDNPPEMLPADPATAVVDEAPAAPAPSAIEILEEPTHAFQLDDLRRARILEAPGQDALGDPAQQQAWEEGLQLAETLAAAIGRSPLAASFAPQARSFHGLRQVGDVRELRFLLFAHLWPTATDQAAAEAVFEIGAAGITGARVVSTR